MSGRALIALALVATALCTATSAAADPTSTAPPQLSGTTTSGGKPFASLASTLTASTGSWSSTAPLLYDVQWQRCSFANAVVDAAPIAYFRLDEKSGSAAADSSGAGFNGTYGGAPLFAQVGALATDGDTSVFFHGRPVGSKTTPVDSLSATIGGGLPAGSAPATVEAWIKPASFYANFEPVVGWAGPKGVDTSASWSLGLAPSSSTSAKLELKAADQAVLSSVTLSPNRWYFVVATDDGTTQQLYVDGAPAGTASLTTSKPSSSKLLVSTAPTGSITLGNFWFSGTIDDVAAYDSILTASDVAAQYAAATDSASGAGCEDIAGATGSTYAVTGADAGAALRAEVTAYGEDGMAWATSSTAAVVGTGSVWPPAPTPQSGPVIDSGTVTDATGAAVAGATVVISPNLATHTVVRPPALATTTTDANGAYQVLLPNSAVSRFEVGGSVDLMRQVVTASGVSTSFFSRTFDAVTGTWTDDNGDLAAPVVTSLDPSAPTTFAPPRLPASIIGNMGCPTITSVIGDADAYAPIGEIHLFADDFGWFTYGAGRSADSTFGLAVSSDGVHFSIGGSTHITNSAQVGWGTSSTPLGPYFSHQLKTKFHFQKTRTLICWTRQYKVSATKWETGALIGADTSGNDGRCNQFPPDRRVVYIANTYLQRTRDQAYTYAGAVSVLGASLSVKSGYSTNVVLTMKFGSALAQHWVCGDNNSPSKSARVFAGP